MNTGDWQGAHFRFSPHTNWTYDKNGFNYPAGIYFKKKAYEEIFSVMNMQERVLWDGGFKVPNGGEDYFEISIEKLDDKTLNVKFEMNSESYEHKQVFADDVFMPKKLDTFAIACPGLRGYDKLRIWDLTNEEEDDEPWSDAPNPATFL